MKRNPVPSLVLDPGRESLVSSSGGLLLRETVRVCGAGPGAVGGAGAVAVGRGRFMTRARCCSISRPRSRSGGDCLADLAVVRAQPAVFGPVASDPTVSRLVAALAADIDGALPAIRAARAQARARGVGAAAAAGRAARAAGTAGR